jgi:undecaprenyl-diphosphatase
MNDFLQDAVNGPAGNSAWLDNTMRICATDLVFFVMPLLLALWFWPVSVRERSLNQRIVVCSCLAIFAALAMGAIIKQFYYEPRPFVSDPSTRLVMSHVPDNGFPSDHGLVSFAVGGAVIWWRRTIGLLALVAALLIGFARVYVGVHWPSDIAGAAVLGLAAGSVMCWAMPALSRIQRAIGPYLSPHLLAAPPE